MMITATFVKDVSPRFRGTAHLYRLSEPVPYGWTDDAVRPTTATVVVSTVWADFTGPETYIFPSDDNGTVLNWGEMKGSFRGAADIPAALENAGFLVAPTKEPTP